MNFNTLPHNLEAEQGLLGNLLVDNSQFYEAYGSIKAEDFYSAAHADIFEKIRQCVEDGKNASPVTIKTAFDNDDRLKEVGGSAYLADLASSVINIHNTADYAETIAELSERRRLICAVEDAHRALVDGGIDSAEIRAELTHSLDSGKPSSFVKTKRQVAAEAVQALKMPKQCYKTGLPSLDKAMAGGLYAGFTYGFCAPQKSGKTTFAHTISHNLNMAGVDHAYIALEMGSAQIEQRNLARDLGLNSMAFLNEKKSQDLLKRAADAAVTVPDHTLYLDMPGGTFTQIKSEIARLVAKKKIKGFVLDYWQLVGGRAQKDSKADFLSEVAQWISDYSRKHGVWNILICQMNRDGSVLGSGGLERACDQLYYIHKSETAEYTADIWLEMRDSRYTPTGNIGSEHNPKFFINTKAGPYIEEAA